ncbi:coiled-coil domain-containing protein 24 [Xiphophorus hellerii]|uniref:coiled-coil domain-containing protein 24 n=1 Tax=Xiphophorus hellerii TaxID=8084 RepID=UPI0013B436CF|nr:coiled-coil domain-containing protein 24 [Xiphophorus hellerii]
MHSPDENQFSCPRQSLWSLITKYVSESELLKIHAALGDPLVDMYTEVHSEAEMWHKKWQESLCYGSHQLQGSPLSDPPVVKELVRGEVKILLETLKGRAYNSERDSEELLLRYNPETLSYVLGHQQIGYCRSSNLKNADNFNRLSSCSSVMSSAGSEIEAVKDMLNVTEIHRVITPLRCVLLEECEALTKMTKHFKKNIKLKCISHLNKPEPSLTELKELRAAIQTDLKFLPSSSGASSSAPVSSKKKSCRFPAESGSFTRLDPTPKSGLRLNLLPLWQPKPRPPSHDPPTRTSSVRTLGLHRSTSASHESVKHTSGDRLDTNLKVTKSQENSSFSTKPDFTDPLCRTCSGLHISSERDSASHQSSQCSVHRPSTDSDWSPHRERKISALCSRNINFTPSPPPPLGQQCDAGSRSSSSSPTDHSVSANGKIKPDDRNNNCSSGRNLVLTVLQKDTSEKTSGISHISGRFDQCGSKKNKSQGEIEIVA